MGLGNRLSITDVAKNVGVTPRTIMRWEKAGKIKKSKRDWRGWRFYQPEDVEEIRRFLETTYEYEETSRQFANVLKSSFGFILFLLTASLFAFGAKCAYAVETQSASTVEVNLGELPARGTVSVPVAEAVKYTLGPEDVIEIEVRRHPEFSGKYAVNSEGKIEYKFVGDILVNGLTKAELKERLTKILSEYIIEPDVNVQIVQYLSKVFYVIGEVGRPGKYYMKGNTITAREALVEAGLPTDAAAMRKTRLITPNTDGQNNFVTIDVCKLVYEGDLSENREMKPGDVLYVPSTVMAKIIRLISPATNIAGQVTGVANSAVIVAP
jgi:polysaccharide export outer membrane protein